MAGPAYTVRYVPIGDPKGTVGDYIDEIPPGGVAVLDNQGRTDATVWGDILTEYAASRHLAGTAIWGVCRDTATALRLGYPMYSHGRFMRTGKDRVEVAGTQVPVALGDAQVRPGDIVVGDDDGVVVIAATASPRWPPATEIAAREDAILAAILDGATIARPGSSTGTTPRKEKKTNKAKDRSQPNEGVAPPGPHAERLPAALCGPQRQARRPGSRCEDGRRLW